MMASAGGAIHLPQPTFDNYVLEVHFYQYFPESNATATLTAGLFVPLPEVGVQSSQAPALNCRCQCSVMQQVHAASVIIGTWDL